MAISKKFTFGSSRFFGEAAALDIRFNIFNIFNTLNLLPFGANSDPTRVQAGVFGTATGGQAGRVGEVNSISFKVEIKRFRILKLFRIRECILRQFQTK